MYKDVFRYGTKIIYAFIILFALLIVTYVSTQINYIESTRTNHVDAIKNEVNLLIKLKKSKTFDLAKTISLDKKLIHIMQTKEYEKLYDDNFFTISKKFKSFENIALQVVDEEGINRYLSWSKKSIGKNILNFRRDLKKLYRDPKPVSNISVGKFDITFKGTIPIYDAQKTFLGIVEVVTHFNSISEYLAKDFIYSALVVEKRFTKQLKFPFSKIFMNGHNISTINLNRDVELFLKDKGIVYFTQMKDEKYLEHSLLSEGYFTVAIPIYGVEKQKIATYLIFIKDIHFLHLKERFLYLLLGVMSLLFFIVSYLVYMVHRKNELLINSLNLRVEEATEKNLALIYHDSLSAAYKKEKLFVDQKYYKESSLVMINIKNFSQINATYGFNAGDSVLRIVAKKLQAILEKSRLYRINADEFVFISDSIEHDINLIREKFKDSSIHLEEENINIRLSFSFGVVAGDENDILRKLSIALKQAKNKPFKAFVTYKEESFNGDFIEFNAYLYDAIFTQREAKIIPYFQGIRDNRTQRTIKYEALARLDVNGKIYTPYFFIEIAKNSGFLYEITKIMIDKSFAFLAKESKEIKISINITEDDLLTKNLKTHLLDALKKYEIDASRITLEILEGISSSGAKNNIVQLKELKSLGFLLAIDDFGVEYSNFERINELDIDFIKIDGKYIKNIDTNEKSYKIANAITGFASSMDIEVIAEFVENEAIQKIVEQMGIELSQGYYFSKPSPTL